MSPSLRQTPRHRPSWTAAAVALLVACAGCLDLGYLQSGDGGPGTGPLPVPAGTGMDGGAGASADLASGNDLSVGPTSTCATGVVDGDESDVDCGGSCPPCALGRACAGDGDCRSKSCSASRCAPSPVAFAATTASTNKEPISLAIGDLDGSGAPDIVVANFGANNGSVILNKSDGSGGFDPPFTVGLAGGNKPISVAIGDSDANGTVDLTFACNTVPIWPGWLDPPNVVTLLGKGDGTFDGDRTFQVFGARPGFVILSHFNGDNLLDAASADENSKTVHVNVAQGNWNYGDDSLEAGDRPTFILARDLSGDGNIDLAVANRDGDSVSVFTGDGQGGFTGKGTAATGNSPRSIAAADFDGDLLLDLAVANRDDGTVTILRGAGQGGFHEGVSIAAGKRPMSVVAGDFNGDGHADLMVVDQDGDRVIPLLGLGTGTFLEGTSISVGKGPRFAAGGDLDLDGRPDLAVANHDSDNVTILVSQ